MPSNSSTREWIIPLEEEGERLDRFLTKTSSPEFSRNAIQHLIHREAVTCNGKIVKKNLRLCAGDQIGLIPPAQESPRIEPESIPLEVLFEDEHLLFLNKPPHLVVHPGAGNHRGTIANALLSYGIDRSSFPEEEIRPGIVHRLDKETSGVLLVAKYRAAQQRLMELFAKREVRKSYLAIVIGKPSTFLIEQSIGRHPKERKKMAVVEKGGRSATTRIEVVTKKDSLTLLHLFPVTGRTHQLRVHLQWIGTPILGDPLYGNMAWNKKWRVPRQFLHASTLSFCHPYTGKPLCIEAPLPEDMAQFQKKFFG